MAIAAKISSTELTAQVTDRFVGTFFEARLINASGTTYEPGVTNDTTFLAFEPTIGGSGYQRQVIGYVSGDVSNYSDDGIGLTTKATTFAHDAVGADIDFSHVALVWSTGNALTLGSVGTSPSAGVNGTYTNIPIDSTSGSGVGITVNLTITNSGAASSDYAVTLVNSGYNYAASDTLTITEGTLAGLGDVVAGAGNLAFSVGTIKTQSNAGEI